MVVCFAKHARSGFATLMRPHVNVATRTFVLIVIQIQKITVPCVRSSCANVVWPKYHCTLALMVPYARKQILYAPNALLNLIVATDHALIVAHITKRDAPVVMNNAKQREPLCLAFGSQVALQQCRICNLLGAPYFE